MVFYTNDLFYYGLSDGSGKGLSVNFKDSYVEPTTAQTCTVGTVTPTLNS